MRRVLLASLAFLGATAVTETTGPSCESCAEGEVCRFGISSDGQSCTTEGVCVEKVTHGAFCSEVEADKSCFSGTCADGLVCLPRIIKGKNIEGICVATCKVGDKVVAQEGEVVPGAGDKWCNRLYCNGEGDLVAYGETKPQCPVAKDLRCCAGEPETNKENHACCGITGLWVLKKDDGTYECDGVVSTTDVRLTPVAPFAHGCLGACGEGMPEGWMGTSPDPEQFCNTCRCIRRELVCTGLDCSKKMKCCPKLPFVPPFLKCCGATGKWAGSPFSDELECGDYTIEKNDADKVPFTTTQCATFDPTSCAVGDKTIASGEFAFHSHPARWCNRCDCNEGVLTCEDARCLKLEDLKCCLPSEKTRKLKVCCGITGTWIEAGDLCGGVEARRFFPQTTPPFQPACAATEECLPNTAVGGPDAVVPVGWTGPSEKPGATWCDTCSCSRATPTPVCVDKKKSNGEDWIKLGVTCATLRKSWCGLASRRDPKASDYCCVCDGGETRQGPGVACTTIAEAECTIGCCPSTAPATQDATGADEEYACCGISRTWVKKAADGYTCGAYVRTTGDAEPFSTECAKTCKHTGVKDTDADYLYTGWTGKDWGDNWCNKCVCEAAGLSCTTNTCKKLCCPKDTKPADDKNPVCCSATGRWMLPNDAGDYLCAHVSFQSGAATGPVGAECADPEQCATVDPKRNVGWRGPGTGLDWCKTCKCAIAGDAPAYSCAGPTVCPTQEQLVCCDPVTEPTDKDKRACCGIAGDWVVAIDDGSITCGPVTVPHAADLDAPFNKPCPTCTVEGLADPVPAGWMGRTRTTEKWCRVCHCVAKGAVAELKCTARECAPLKCCGKDAPSGDWACCGKTGEWVEKNGDDYTCAGVATPTTNLPPFMDKCANDEGCEETEFSTFLAPGSLAAVGGGCKRCHCSLDKVLTCRPATCA